MKAWHVVRLDRENLRLCVRQTYAPIAEGFEMSSSYGFHGGRLVDALVWCLERVEPLPV